jgi:cell division protein FtsL
MHRLLLALVGILVIGATLLLLRQQHLRLRAECHQLHQELYEIEQTLWQQQVQVATVTAPDKIRKLADRLSNLPDEPTTVDEWANLDLGDGW